MIYAWDNYPLQQFPGLWDWMTDQIEQGELVMPSVALDEVAHKAPECAEWLKDRDLDVLEITNAILQDAMRIKGLLGIIGDKYHPKGGMKTTCSSLPRRTPAMPNLSPMKANRNFPIYRPRERFRQCVPWLR